MNHTTAADVINFFESSFADKQVLPRTLELIWLEKAIGRYSFELSPLNYNREIQEFDMILNCYTIDTLAVFMKESYQERQVSLVNKRVSIAGRDLSIDASDHSKKYAENELHYISAKAREMVANQKLEASL